MEETISLQELLGTLRKRLNLIVSITLAAVTVAAVISYFFITPILSGDNPVYCQQVLQ